MKSIFYFFLHNFFKQKEKNALRWIKGSKLDAKIILVMISLKSLCPLSFACKRTDPYLFQ
jgi:hypothetical protein